MTQERQILKLLMEHGWVSTKTLQHDLFIYQYNARIKGLRDRGFSITAEKRERNGYPVCGFRLDDPKHLIDWDSLTVREEKVTQEELF